MSKRLINCSACKGCHTGRGGEYCLFFAKQQDMTASDTMSDIPDKGSPEYESYLAAKIAKEEERLRKLQVPAALLQWRRS